MDWEKDFSEYHEVGDSGCPACLEAPGMCMCGGLFHTQLEPEELEILQVMCDRCYVESSIGNLKYAS